MYLNWVDAIILVVLGYYLLSGWETGLVQLVANLVSFLGSLWLAIQFHAPVGSFLTEKFGLSSLWSNVLGYLIVGLIADFVINGLLGLGIPKLPKKWEKSKANKVLGTALSFVNGVVIIAFFLLVILSLPLRGTIKQDIRQSVIGKRIVVLVETYGGQVKSALDVQVAEAIKFLTVEPKSTERINLDIEPSQSQLTVDEVSERKMLELVNNERAKVGVKPLSVDAKIVAVARAHSRDMFVRRYFSHVDPDGNDPLKRMLAGGVLFTLVGENIAYAPDVSVAHTGLMNSEGHRRNILDPQFHRIGIGVMDGGIYGEMFTQNFAN